MSLSSLRKAANEDNAMIFVTTSKKIEAYRKRNLGNHDYKLVWLQTLYFRDLGVVANKLPQKFLLKLAQSVLLATGSYQEQCRGRALKREVVEYLKGRDASMFYSQTEVYA